MPALFEKQVIAGDAGERRRCAPPPPLTRSAASTSRMARCWRPGSSAWPANRSPACSCRSITWRWTACRGACCSRTCMPPTTASRCPLRRRRSANGRCICSSRLIAGHRRRSAIVARAPRATRRADPGRLSAAGAPNNAVGDASSVSFELDEADTTALLRRLPRAYDTRINDVLLIALAQACSMVTGNARTRIDLESRPPRGGCAARPHPDGGLVHVHLPRRARRRRDAHAGASAACRAAAAAPDSGRRSRLCAAPLPGPDAAVRDSLAALPRADILFNYHGQLDTVLQQSDGWRPATEDLGSLRAGRSQRTRVRDRRRRGRRQASGGLALRRAAPPAADGRNGRALQGTGCSTSRRRSQTPQPTTSTTATRSRRCSRASCSIRCTTWIPPPISSSSASSSAARSRCRRSGRRGPCARARHAVLRTAFAWADREQPVQTVLHTVELPWTVLDWRHRDASRRAQDFDAFLADDRKRGFDLQRAPLFRCTLIQETDTRHRFCWSAHHIILDGWSTAT